MVVGIDGDNMSLPEVDKAVGVGNDDGGGVTTRDVVGGVDLPVIGRVIL